MQFMSFAGAIPASITAVLFRFFTIILLSLLLPLTVAYSAPVTNASFSISNVNNGFSGPAVLNSITIGGNTYPDFILPNSLTVVNLKAPAVTTVTDRGVVQAVGTGGNYNAQALQAYQDRDLNHFVTTDDPGGSTQATPAANATTTYRLNYNTAIPISAQSFIVITERNGNNAYYVLARNAGGGVIGTIQVPVSAYRNTGAEGSCAGCTGGPPATQDVFAAIYPLTDFAGSGDIRSIEVRCADDPGEDCGDGKVFLIRGTPDIQLTKSATYVDTDGSGTRNAGDVINYSYRIENTGTLTLTNVTVTDPLPNLNFTGSPIASLAAGAVNTTAYRASYTITQADITRGYVKNRATVTAGSAGGNVSDISDVGTRPAVTGNGTVTGSENREDTVTGVPNTSNTGNPGDDHTIVALPLQPALRLTKSATIADTNGSGVVDTGDVITYAYRIENTGNVPLTNVSLTDPLPGLNLTGSPIASMAPGDVNTTAYTATYTITQTDADAGYVRNSAVASGQDPNNNPVTDISDTGDGTETTEDTTPGVPNDVTNPNDPTDDPTISVIPPMPSIQLTKSASLADTNNSGRADAGDVVTYSFRVENTGNVTLTNVRLSDNLPNIQLAGGPIATMAPGQVDDTTFSATYTLTQDDVNAGYVRNTSVATGTPPVGSDVTDTSDTGDGTETSEDTTTGVPNDLTDPNDPTDDPTIVVAPAEPELQLTKSSTWVDTNGSTLADPGDIINYTFRVENTGNVTLTNIRITDSLDGIVLTGGPIARMEPGDVDETTFTASYTITQEDVDRGYVVNTATASGSDPNDDPVEDVSDTGEGTEETEDKTTGVPEVTDPNDPTDDPTVQILPSEPGIMLTKYFNELVDSNGNEVDDVGDTAHYSFKVTNTGNVTLSNITIADPLVGIVLTGGPIATLAPGESDSTTFKATYRVTLDDLRRGHIENTSVATGSLPNGEKITDDSDTGAGTEDTEDSVDGIVNTSDPNDPGDDPTIVELEVLPVDGLTITKVATRSRVKRGELVPYVIEVINANDTPAGPVDIVDTLPIGFSYYAGSATVDGEKVEPTVSGRAVTFPYLFIPASGSVVIEVTTRVGAGVQAGKFTNHADVYSPIFGEKVAPTASATVEVEPEHVFDCGEIIGKVFDDKNQNGYQDQGEIGLAGVRVTTVRGLLITTDRHGRYNVPCADIPNADIGSNFIVKVDTRTLPTGYRVTTENPRVVRLTRGKLTEANFGASISRLVRVKLNRSAFEGNGKTPNAQTLQNIRKLGQHLSTSPSVLRLTYHTAGESQALALSRLSEVQRLVRRNWRKRGNYKLVIEQHVIAGK